MSVKLIHNLTNLDACAEAERLVGFCYGRLNPTGKAFGHKLIPDGSKVSIDLSKYGCDITADNPITVTIDFGIVPVESKSTRDVTIFNSEDPRAPIPQDFVVLPREPLMEKYDKVFHILLPEKNNFVFQPKGGNNNLKFKFRVLFAPKLPAITYTNTICIWLGNIPIKLRCQGFSEGPYVSISQNVLNFGAQYYGTEIKIAVDLLNHSICEAIFQFDTDNFRSPFKICPITGVIPPKQSLRVDVLFRPHKPQTYYKRVYCLLHQQNPQYIDLVGVCVPRPFFFEKPIDFCVSSADTQFLPLPSPTFQEYFEHASWGISLSQEDFNFGGVDAGTLLRPKQAHSLIPFTLTSYLPYDVLIEWVPDPSQAFSVTPPTGFMNSFQGADFELHFTPGLPDVFYSGQLECYIYPTTLAWPPWHGPPWAYTTKMASESTMKVAIAIQNEGSDKPGPSHCERKKDLAEVQHLETVAQKARKRASKIPFELFVVNGEATVQLCITAEKHYTALNFEEEDQIPHTEKCGISAEVQEEEIEEEEVEEEEEPNQTSETDGPGSSRKAKKKKKGKGSKKSKKKKGSKKAKSKESGKSESKESKKEKKKKSEKSKSKESKKKAKSKESKKGKSKDSKKKSKKKKKKDGKIESGDEEEEYLEMFSDEFAGEEENWHTMEVECPEPPELEKRTSQFDIFECKMAPVAVDDEAVVPDQSCTNELAIPLCLTIRAAGHTYEPLKQPPIPHFSIPSKVTMSPTLPQHRESRTIVMRNTNDIPIFYDLRDTDKSNEFDVKPKIGVIPGDGKQIVMISMCTSEPFTIACNHVCNVNMNVIDDNPLALVGFAEVPSLIMKLLSDPTGKLMEILCPTTIPGFATFAEMTMKNPSRFHYKYQLECGEEDELSKRIFTPIPSDGILAPYDCKKITWKFVPMDEIDYKIPWNFRFVVMGAKNEESLWNAAYTTSIPLVGFGRPSELVSKPEVLDFDLVQIFDAVTKHFTITNSGKSVIVANLQVRHEQWLEWFPKEQVFICPTQIHLQAGESTKILVTVRPDKPVMYKFFVVYTFETDEKDEEGNVLVPYQPKPLVEIRFMGDHAITQVSEIQQIGNHPVWGVDQAMEMFSIAKLNQYLIPLSNTAREGSLPIVPTVVFEFPSAPINSISSVFSIALKNLSEKPSYWQIHTLPPKNSKLYQLRQKTQKRESFIGSTETQDSPSFLTALWTQKYEEINGKHPYRSDESLSLSALKNGENFKISPAAGVLQGKDQAIVSFKCVYECVGPFRMPVLLRIYPAIFVWLELHGKCLGREQGDLQVQATMEFHPIALANLDPPIQSVWMYNGGAVSVPFNVDLSPFKKIKKENYGHECIECLTITGVALPKSWTPVKLRFSPVELTAYKAELRIIYYNNVLKVQVEGSPANAEDIDLRPKAKPHHSDISDPFVPVCICPTRVIFPHFIPTADRATGLIYITNNSETHSFSFAWPEVTHVNSTSIKFLPDIGILAPREQCACQVIVTAGNVNHIMCSTVRCWIEDVTAIDEYNYIDKVYRGEIIEVREMTVVTKEKGPQKVKQAVSQLSPPVLPQAHSRLLTISCYIGSVFGMLDSIMPKEQAKMTFSDPVGLQPVHRGGGDSDSSLMSPVNRHLAKQVLSQMLWDMTLLSPNWPSHIRDITKRQSVYFEDYKNSENSVIKKDEKELHDGLHLPRKTTEEIMEFSLFNMLQEMADHYSNGRKDWPVLGAGSFP